MKPRNSHSYDRSCVKMTDRFQSIEKQTRRSNNKTIIELDYRKMSRYFAQPRPIIVNNFEQNVRYLSTPRVNRPLAQRGHVTNASFKQ